MYVEFKARLNKFSLRWRVSLECYSCDKEKEIKSPGLGRRKFFKFSPKHKHWGFYSLMKAVSAGKELFIAPHSSKGKSFPFQKRADLFNHCPDSKHPMQATPQLQAYWDWSSAEENSWENNFSTQHLKCIFQMFLELIS